MSTKKTMQQPRADWGLTPRGPGGAAALSGLTLAAAAVVGGPMLDVPVVWPIAATTAGAALTYLTGRDLARRTLVWRLAARLLAGGWLTWALLTDLWAPEPWLTLVGLSTAGGMTYTWASYPGGRTNRHGHQAGLLGNVALPVTGIPRRDQPLAEEWVRRIQRVARVRVRVTGMQTWGNGGGFSLQLRLPDDGTSLDTMDGYAVRLAASADLPAGCNVEFRGGGSKRSVWMDVATVNRLVEDLDYPGDHSPRSILDGITLGLCRNGDPLTLQVRQPRTIVVGTTGSAKTGTLHAATAALGRCEDGLTWQMDLNGGNVSIPWLRPWLDGHTDRPAIDWAACCAEEALLMADAKVRIALERKTAYAALRLASDEDKLPISPAVPQITTILDEGHEVLSDSIRDPIQREIRKLIEKTARIGRAEAVTYLLSTLRSISGTLSTDLLNLMHNRLFMAGGEQKEANYLYDYAKGVNVQDLAGPGSGFARRFGSPEVRSWKAYRLKPARDIRPASLAVSGIRPELDAPSAAAAGDAYATRLDRMRWCFSTPEEREHLTPPAPVELPGLYEPTGEPLVWHPALTHPPASRSQMEPRPEPGKPVRQADSERHLRLLRGGATAGWEDPAAIAARARAERVASGAAPMPRTAAATATVVHAEQVLQLAVAGQELPEIVRRVLTALGKARDGRLHSEVLAARVGVDSKAELAELLRPLGLAPLPNSFERGGKKRRGYDLADARACADRIAAGEQEVPDHIAAWPDVDQTDDQTDDVVDAEVLDGSPGDPDEET
ncbi:hypothetical protein ACIBG7_43380 [Nonomuraea sp. NPDC050328]|uniref:hypothetical protein n=1 Tax=Nonomuraea sp. NPDC050328 TaxID=3364361 RepID=UPI00379D8333